MQPGIPFGQQIPVVDPSDVPFDGLAVALDQAGEASPFPTVSAVMP